MPTWYFSYILLVRNITKNCVFFFFLLFISGLATGIYTTNNPEACQFVCADAGCNIVVVENDVQLQKILQVS